MFKQYQHVERLGTLEVEDIEIGSCCVFPKIDGTNGSVWIDDGKVVAASRNRVLTIENDNAGFCKYILENENIKRYLTEFPNHRLFGEFLVPHTLKTYRKDSWNKFYVFDVQLIDDVSRYLSYESYEDCLKKYDLDYIPALAKVKNPTDDALYGFLERNTFLIEDGKGVGEGIVVKNYDYFNRFGRQTWAKIVRNEFKEKHVRNEDILNLNLKVSVESRIVDDFCTIAFVEKELAKIVVENKGWSSKKIPMLLGRVFYTLVKEESWNIIKKYRNPVINFKLLNSLVIQKIKEVKPNLF